MPYYKPFWQLNFIPFVERARVSSESERNELNLISILILAKRRCLRRCFASINIKNAGACAGVFECELSYSNYYLLLTTFYVRKECNIAYDNDCYRKLF